MERMHHFIQTIQNKIGFLILMTLLTACADSMETERPVINGTYFSPASWILGTWEEISDEQQEFYMIRSFEFSETNFIVNPLAEDIYRIDFNKYINKMLNYFPSFNAEIKVEKTEELYQLSISPPIVTDNYSFKKIDEKTIICSHNEGAEFRLGKIK